MFGSSGVCQRIRSFLKDPEKPRRRFEDRESVSTKGEGNYTFAVDMPNPVGQSSNSNKPGRRKVSLKFLPVIVVTVNKEINVAVTLPT